MALAASLDKGDFGTYKVHLSGSLDSDTYREFESAIAPALEDPEARALRLEIQGLSFISSMGLGAIAKAKKAMDAKGGVVATVGAQPQVAKVFQIVRMLPKETVFATREEADEYLATIQRRVIEGELPDNGGIASA